MTADPTALELLKRSPLFGPISEEDLSRVAVEMTKHSFRQGQIIFARGDASKEIYFVVEGRVRLAYLGEDGRGVAFRHATAWEMFGEIAALDGGPRTADATAISKVRTFTLSRPSLKRLLTASPNIAETVICYLCNRLRETTDQLQEVALSPVDVRLSRFLLHTLRISGNISTGARAKLNLGMSQSELALLIGASRQSANAALAILERSGAVKRHKNGLECDIGLLTRLAAIE